MIRILRAIAKTIGADVGEDVHLHALSERTKPEKLAKQIETRDEDKTGRQR